MYGCQYTNIPDIFQKMSDMLQYRYAYIKIPIIVSLVFLCMNKQLLDLLSRKFQGFVWARNWEQVIIRTRIPFRDELLH